MRVILFDDVFTARRETFNIPGLEVEVHGDADDCVAICTESEPRPGAVFMDYSMGDDHVRGEDAIRALRKAGYTGRIVAMSSDPQANEMMKAAGADEAFAPKALLRSFLVKLGRDAGG